MPLTATRIRENTNAALANLKLSENSIYCLKRLLLVNAVVKRSKAK